MASSAGVEVEGGFQDELRRAIRRWVLEPRVAIRESEIGCRDDDLHPVAPQDPRRFQDGGDVRPVGAGVGPDSPADRARDGEPELESGQPRLLGLGRRPRHRDAGLGHVALAVHLGRLGADLDHEATDAAVADDDVAPPAQDQVRDVARPGESDDGPQLVLVANGREQVGRATDPHRREPGKRLVPGGLDPDPTLDLGPDGDGVEWRRTRGHAGSPDSPIAPRDRRSTSTGSGQGRR